MSAGPETQGLLADPSIRAASSAVSHGHPHQTGSHARNRNEQARAAERESVVWLDGITTQITAAGASLAIETFTARIFTGNYSDDAAGAGAS